jgi:hypothetical protein
LCTTSAAATITFAIRASRGCWSSVPVHNRDLKRGTLRAILREAGLTADELRDLL